MKPHLIRRNGVWLCFSRGAMFWRKGYGFSPSSAYLEWLTGWPKVGA